MFYGAPETRPDRMTKTSRKTTPLFLGIDTGGTYTDAVLWREATGATPGAVVAKAKALTTRHDLAVGISGAVDRVLAEAKVDPAGDKARLDVDHARHQRAGRGPGRPRGAGHDRLLRNRPSPRRLEDRARHRSGRVLPGRTRRARPRRRSSTCPASKPLCRNWRRAYRALPSAPISRHATPRTRSPPAT